MEDFIRQFAEVLEVSAGTISPNDKFRDYEEWDSLALLSLMAMLEDEYNITIPRDSFQKINTVQELYNFIKSN